MEQAGTGECTGTSTGTGIGRRILEEEFGVEGDWGRMRTSETTDTTIDAGDDAGDTAALDTMDTAALDVMFSNVLAQTGEVPIERTLDEVIPIQEGPGKNRSACALPGAEVMRNRMRVQAWKDRQKNKRPRLQFGDHGQYAMDRASCRDWANQREECKPRWAVTGLVWIRSEGMCEVCGCVVDKEAQPRQLAPPTLGGMFSEPNVVLACKYCLDSWPRKNYFLTPAFKMHKLELFIRILSGRARRNTLSERARETLIVYRSRLMDKRDEAREVISKLHLINSDNEQLRSPLLV